MMLCKVVFDKTQIEKNLVLNQGCIIQLVATTISWIGRQLLKVEKHNFRIIIFVCELVAASSMIADAT